MKKVIITELAALSAKDKEKLTKNGYIVIEAKDPTKIVFLNEIELVDTNTFLMSALRGLQEGGDFAKRAFTDELWRRMKDIERLKSISQT